jgi:ferredoxin
MLKVIIDQDRCVGAGQCVLAASEVFDQRDEDGVVVLLRPDAPAGQEEDVREAARLCPALAIELDES